MEIFVYPTKKKNRFEVNVDVCGEELRQNLHRDEIFDVVAEMLEGLGYNQHLVKAWLTLNLPPNQGVTPLTLPASSQLPSP